jgi:hypothetical protein
MTLLNNNNNNMEWWSKKKSMRTNIYSIFDLKINSHKKLRYISLDAFCMILNIKIMISSNHDFLKVCYIHKI